jgi:hypothetical protein
MAPAADPPDSGRVDESVREMAVADLLEDLRRLSPLERDFLDRWRATLGTTSRAPQLARVFDRLKLLASVEAKAQRDQDFAILAAIDDVEFGAPAPEPLPPDA